MSSQAAVISKPIAEPEVTSPVVRTWLYLLAFLVALMVVIGGYVRLTRSGLSIVEWNVITGVLPPLSEAAWEAEFAKYQQTPEFQKVNFNMTLDGYRRIFLIEWAHRLIARLVGLIVLAPLAWFLARGVIPWRRAGVYIALLALFGFQGFLGWFMVASGLVDRPHVSHYRLTIHLLAALSVLAIAWWKALDLTPRFAAARQRAANPGLQKLAQALLAVAVLQIAYGGLVAGLKAGYVSNTWPLMFGTLVPKGLLSVLQPWWQNLVETPATVHFIHRWFAFVVLTLALVFWWRARGTDEVPTLRQGSLVMVAVVVFQILVGIGVVIWSVPLPVALLHQGVAVALFAAALFLNHQLWRRSR